MSIFSGLFSFLSAFLLIQRLTIWLQMRQEQRPYPQLLDQVHVGSLVLLHAPLRDAGHVCSQRSINENTQHVQHCCEEFTVGEADRRIK